MNYYLWDPSRLIPRQYKDKQQSKRFIKIKQMFGKGEKSWPNKALHLTPVGAGELVVICLKKKFVAKTVSQIVKFC